MSRKGQRLHPALTRVKRILIPAAVVAFAANAQNLACPASNGSGGPDFRGQRIEHGNFSHQDLTNANFSGTTLIAPFFDFANLKNANFQDAIILNDSSNPVLVADFSFANLEGACFVGAKFNGPTYFTSASLTCADFSKTDLSAGNAIFGESPLRFDREKTGCRLAFRESVMSCEFVSDWRFLDLTGADIKACANDLAGRDLSGSKLDSVNLQGANLEKTKFVRADLSRAILDQASLQNADLSYATLLGAHLNRANLTGANLYHAFLSNDTPSGITNAASVRQAHLKNANLSFAQLSGVDFTYSNFYGHDPAGTGVCKTAPSRDKCRESSTNYEGFTCDCAAAHGAIVTQTKFSRAYLYGVDFTAAAGQGVDFREAVLTGSNFAGASISSDPKSGTASTFFRAFLQGANLDGAQLKDRPNLADAFVDFTPGGNNIYIFLDGANHNEFPCADCEPPMGSNVCVLVNYPEPTKVPEENVAFTCPNGFIGDCGAADPSGENPKWKSRIADLGAPPAGVPPAWYEHDATYSKAPENPNMICNGQGPDSAIVFW